MPKKRTSANPVVQPLSSTVRVMGRDPQGRLRVVGVGPTGADAMAQAKADAASYVEDYPATKPLSRWTFHAEG